MTACAESVADAVATSGYKASWRLWGRSGAERGSHDGGRSEQWQADLAMRAGRDKSLWCFTTALTSRQRVSCHGGTTVGQHGDRAELWAVSMARALAENGIECNQAFTGQETSRPLIGNRSHYYTATCRPPRISIRVQCRAQGTYALLVPSSADGRRRQQSFGSASDAVFGAEKVDSFNARVILPRCTTGILQSAAKLAVVEVLHIADGEEPHVVLRVINYIMAEIRCHG